MSFVYSVLRFEMIVFRVMRTLDLNKIIGFLLKVEGKMA